MCMCFLGGEQWRRGPVGDDCPLKRELRFSFLPPINHKCFVESLTLVVFLLFCFVFLLLEYKLPQE